MSPVTMIGCKRCGVEEAVKDGLCHDCHGRTFRGDRV